MTEEKLVALGEEGGVRRSSKASNLFRKIESRNSRLCLDCGQQMKGRRDGGGVRNSPSSPTDYRTMSLPAMLRIPGCEIVFQEEAREVEERRA